MLRYFHSILADSAPVSELGVVVKVLLTLVGTVAMSAVVYHGARHKQKCIRLIREWGRAQGLQITAVRAVSFRRRPIFWSRWQERNITFEIDAVAENRSMVHGWVNILDGWTLRPETILVKWDSRDGPLSVQKGPTGGFPVILPEDPSESLR